MWTSYRVIKNRAHRQWVVKWPVAVDIGYCVCFQGCWSSALWVSVELEVWWISYWYPCRYVGLNHESVHLIIVSIVVIKQQGIFMKVSWYWLYAFEWLDLKLCFCLFVFSWILWYDWDFFAGHDYCFALIRSVVKKIANGVFLQHHFLTHLCNLR